MPIDFTLTPEQLRLRGDARAFARDVVERSKTVPVLANLFKLPHLLLLGGGIVIKVGDEVVGAIGAAGAPGGDLDDACARAGLDKIKDQLK